MTLDWISTMTFPTRHKCFVSTTCAINAIDTVINNNIVILIILLLMGIMLFDTTYIDEYINDNINCNGDRQVDGVKNDILYEVNISKTPDVRQFG